MTVSPRPEPATVHELYRRMLLIRRMEERLAEVVSSGELPGAVHLYIGQEAVAAGVCVHLDDHDWIASTHRGHGHFLAKGGEPHAMMAEILGRDTGICRGKGGSMHVADFARGILGANGIVGGGIGLAVGAALAAQLDGQGRVAVAFFGDGGANQGVVMEALNLAAIWKLPLLLVCENNGFSEFSPTATVTAGEIAARAHPFGLPGVVVDGNDVLAVWEAAGKAVGRARTGHGAPGRGRERRGGRPAHPLPPRHAAAARLGAQDRAPGRGRRSANDLRRSRRDRRCGCRAGVQRSAWTGQASHGTGCGDALRPVAREGRAARRDQRDQSGA